MTNILLPFTFILGIAAAAPVAAADGSAAATGPSVKVSYGDLNLGSDAGVAKFDRRIKGAIRTVCGTADLRVLKEVKQMRACRIAAKARIADQRTQALAARDRAGLLAFAKPK